MKHRKAGRKYSRTREHRIAMFRNMLMNLIKHSRIQTTDAKAKGLKRIADKVISLARTNNLSNIRKASYFVKDKDLLKKLFSEIGPKFVNRSGGYTRIYKVGIRRGDSAPVSVIEFAFEEEKKVQKKGAKKTAKVKKETKKAEKSVSSEKNSTETPKDNV